jgi:hypothetical protein
MLLNAAAGIVTVAALLGAARSMLFSPSAEPCSERYRNMTAFSLERGGALVTAADLQAGVAGRDAGVIENLAISKVSNAPAPLAMSVSLNKGSASPRWAAGAKGGMSYPWEPRALQSKTAACLTYHVMLPADFDFHRGGVLPGFAGSDGNERGEAFFARLVWRPAGRAGVAVHASAAPGNTGTADAEAFDFPRGRWVKLEQEVVLNTPKKADGTLRLWVDGVLAVDRTDIAYRSTGETTLASVAADVHYGGADHTVAAPKDAKVWLSPFQVRWQ